LDANVTPLILIQLPDRKTNTEDILRERVEKILDSHGISVKKQNLGIHLSGHHENLEDIKKNDSEIRVLIFKQALALGWDCPRAQILVLFRVWKSVVFSIQTVGRIMRMPEPDKGHYENNILNHAYVYTNLGDISITEDIAKKYITIFTSERIKNYEPINLTSYHSKRQREKTRLAPIFISVFLEAAKRYGLKNKIDLKAKKIKQQIISDWRTENINLGSEGLQKDEIAAYKMGLADLQKYFDYFARNSLRHFYPEDRSTAKVKEAIYSFFDKEYRMSYEDEEDIVQIVLSNKNEENFINVINEAEDDYLKRVSEREKELLADNKWNIPEFIKYNDNYIEDNYKKSVIEPFYDGQLTVEKNFIKFLDKSEKVEWWFKNGDRDAVFFAVPYSIGNDTMPFYIDFVVKLKDGQIGLFDTKGELTLQAGGP
jgi:type III restriction enzyme